jgi:hypothetical protein
MAIKNGANVVLNISYGVVESRKKLSLGQSISEKCEGWGFKG